VNGVAGTALAVSAGYQHTCAVTSTERIVCWGNNQSGQSAPTNVTIVPVFGIRDLAEKVLATGHTDTLVIATPEPEPSLVGVASGLGLLLVRAIAQRRERAAAPRRGT